MGNLDNSFVIGIFDCCREAYNEGVFPPKADRGGQGILTQDVEIEKGRNVMLIFGCPPSKLVPGVSKIAS